MGTSKNKTVLKRETFICSSRRITELTCLKRSYTFDCTSDSSFTPQRGSWNSHRATQAKRHCGGVYSRSWFILICRNRTAKPSGRARPSSTRRRKHKKNATLTGLTRVDCPRCKQHALRNNTKRQRVGKGKFLARRSTRLPQKRFTKRGTKLLYVVALDTFLR